MLRVTKTVCSGKNENLTFFQKILPLNYLGFKIKFPHSLVRLQNKKYLMRLAKILKKYLLILIKRPLHQLQ